MGKRKSLEAFKDDERVRNWVPARTLLAQVGAQKPISKLLGLDKPQKKTHSFSHSEGFRTVLFKGKRFELTVNQSRVVEAYFKAFQIGKPEMPQSTILERLDIQSGRLRDVFKKHPKAFKSLLREGQRRGSYRLNLP